MKLPLISSSFEKGIDFNWKHGFGDWAINRILNLGTRIRWETLCNCNLPIIQREQVQGTEFQIWELGIQLIGLGFEHSTRKMLPTGVEHQTELELSGKALGTWETLAW